MNLTTVELLARQDQAVRAKGIVFQGSNDGTTWTTIAGTGASTIDWQTFAVSSSKTPYRYIRIYNGGTWCGNMAEVRLHGSLHSADTTAPVTTDNAPSGTVNQDTAVILTPTDAGGSGVQATYYTVDGGAQQTGTTIALTTDGTHTLVYWSVDWAGNVEQKHTVTVTVDKTAPAAAGLYADVTAPTNQNVAVSIYYPVDASVREYNWVTPAPGPPYTAPVVVTANTTVYARGTDASGNVSAVSSLVVANINKVPPAGASFTPSSMDPTTGNVTVAVTYPASVVARQYRVGDAGGWTPYTGPVVVTDNAVSMREHGRRRQRLARDHLCRHQHRPHRAGGCAVRGQHHRSDQQGRDGDRRVPVRCRHQGVQDRRERRMDGVRRTGPDVG